MDRGPAEYLAAIIVKSLVKHGWPAKAFISEAEGGGFFILHHKLGGDAYQDFWGAVEIACRIAARTYRLDITEETGWVRFNKVYRVTSGRHFQEVKT